MTLTPWQFGLGLIFAIFALMAGIYVALEQIAAWRERRARRITAAQLARCTSPAFRGRGCSPLSDATQNRKGEAR